MGSGSSANAKGGKKYEEPPDLPPAAPAQPHVPPRPPVEKGAGGMRVCDRCGEMRKCAQLGDEDQFLCAACNLFAPSSKIQKKLRESDAEIAPQPVLRRGETMAAAPAGGPRRRRSTGEEPSLGRLVDPIARTLDASKPSAEGSADADQPPKEGKRTRRRAKERALLSQEAAAQAQTAAQSTPGAESDTAAPQAKPAFRRAQTAMDFKIGSEPRGNYRKADGLMSLRGQMGVELSSNTAGLHLQTPFRETKQEQLEDADSPGLPPAPRKPLGAGFMHGDRVHSLVSRVRNGQPVLDIGHEGTVVGTNGSGGSEDDLRLLVQFRHGFDWLLPARQICLSTAYSSVRATGLPGGFSWGARVRSLVTYLHPQSKRKEVFLGDTGTVIGPGTVRGKVAIRFDDGKEEFSIWPSVVCAADSYDAVVAQKLSAGFCRGDRVRARGACKGARAEAGRHALQEGQEGTIVGPGHADGWILVHFDSDERVWSLKPNQINAGSGLI